ncbi:MAG TPA: helix-turn-helix domain-containing protein [Croceibacterium sp.]|nr:helix-turn-helix domain-containing protein [Croceibacterium sp.]
MDAEFTTEVKFYRLSEALQPYFTALYATSVECSPDVWVKDRLHPEWAALRFTEGPAPIACVGVGEMQRQWPFVANGPTSKAIQFSVTRSRVWGLGLQPAGWSKFVDLPANMMSDRTVDGATHEAFALFRPIHDIVQGAGGDGDRIALGINDFLMGYVDRPVPQEAQILACQQALRDPDIANVIEFGERLGMNRRSLERLCGRYFGFPPKLLLRRQRFLRSLAQFMLHSAGSWSKALDWQYYDQAQFVRDFRSFMGTTPSEYADAPHPILEKVMAQRMADQGAAPETDLPTVLRYGGDAESVRD